MVIKKLSFLRENITLPHTNIKREDDTRYDDDSCDPNVLLRAFVFLANYVVYGFVEKGNNDFTN